MQYIANLEDGMNLVEFYLCMEKQSLVTKAGKTYLKLLLGDKTGSLNAMVWNIDDRIGPFEKNDIVKVRAAVGVYQGDKQLNVTQLRKALPDEYTQSDYFRTPDESVESIYGKIRAAVAGLENPYLGALLDRFFPLEGPAKTAFVNHPAAKGFHHNYSGGLAEHTLSVYTIAKTIQTQYPLASSDLVTAGALLHDIGKLEELSEPPLCDYTDKGRLMGHLVIGAMKVAQAASEIPGFPEGLKDQLIHIILSHHGSLEFGSPVLPATAEALVVHLADDADAKMKELKDGIALDREDGNWTAFNKALQRYIYKPEQ